MLMCTRVALTAAVLAFWTSMAFADGIEPGLWKITTRVETGGVVESAARVRKMSDGGRNTRPRQDIFTGREHRELGMRAARTQLCRR
jgi:hypothetical protein